MTLLAEETVAELDGATSDVTVDTPCAKFRGPLVDVGAICCVSIVRAGDGLLERFRSILPGVSAGKILIQRDESSAGKEAKLFYSKLPADIRGKAAVVLCDPMLATGGSAIKAIESLETAGVDPSSITFSNVVSCPEGISNLSRAYPDVKIVTACVDEGLNDQRYIVPGLGDYGDRFFNTA